MNCIMENVKQKVAIINLGCKVNKYESDAMKDKLSTEGFCIVEPEEKADVYIVNTCSVTNMAQKKSRQMLRRAKKMNPQAIIVAAGCYVNAEHDNLKQEDFIDIVVSNNCKKDIVTVLREYFANQITNDYYVEINRTNEYEEMGCLAVDNMDHRRAYIKIQDGCNQFCSYCIIPFTRGRVRSRSAENILNEIKQLAENGIKEFVLTGIHISSYGIDFRGKSLQYDDVMQQSKRDVSDGVLCDKNEMLEENVISERLGTEQYNNIVDLGQLVEAISDIPEVERIRLGSLEPRIVTEKFLQGLQRNKKFCPHFHLSLQSACNDTLKRMNRKYSIEEFHSKCELIRQYFHKPAITTDVIVGFPGETEEEFAITLQNLKQLNLYEIHVFKYSVRSGTVAEKLPQQIPESIKGERSDILLKLTAEQKATYEASMAGEVEEVLIEEILQPDKDTADLKEVKRVTEMAGVAISVEDAVGIRYYTGHTKRYIKVKIPAVDNIVNQIVKVKFI